MVSYELLQLHLNYRLHCDLIDKKRKKDFSKLTKGLEIINETHSKWIWDEKIEDMLGKNSSSALFSVEIIVMVNQTFYIFKGFLKSS